MPLLDELARTRNRCEKSLNIILFGYAAREILIA